MSQSSHAQQGALEAAEPLDTEGERKVAEPRTAERVDVNTRHSGRMLLISTVMLVVGGLGGAMIQARGDDDGPGPVSSPPALSELSATWNGDEGRYELTGLVENLRDGQMVWSYNQLVDADGGEPIYPDHGPCWVDSAGRFTCDLGWAGRPVEDAGKTFALWAAVVTDEDAHEAASVKANLDGRAPFGSVAAVPHVDGADTIGNVEKARPGSP